MSIVQELLAKDTFIKYSHPDQRNVDHGKLLERVRVLAKVLSSLSGQALAPDLACAEASYSYPNSYHNFHHALAVCHTAVNEYLTDYPDDVDGAIDLFRAALYHDSRHTGGRNTDLVNVSRAINYVYSDRLSPRFPSDHVNRVADLIHCTMFVNGKFPIEPVTLTQKYLRDADLASFLQPTFPAMMLGLQQETGREFTLQENIQFLQGCTFYTNRIKRQFDQFVATYREGSKAGA